MTDTKELLERIEQLEKRVVELEAGEFRSYPPVLVPHAQVCTCGSPQTSAGCPVHGCFQGRATTTVFSNDERWKRWDPKDLSVGF